MKRDLAGILSGKYEEIPIEESVALPEMLKSGNLLTFLGDVHVAGKLYVHKDSVICFSGALEAEIETLCGRCLIPLTTDVKIDFDETVYAKEEEASNDLIVEPDGETIDLEEFIFNLFELKLPMKFLCKEDCKGLCPNCGVNLNTSACSCQEEQIDERFAKLKILLDDGAEHK